MWAEARKHEKKLKGLMVDYRRRAERRREFYDRIRSDPALFLQIHGIPLKIHIDPNLSSLAESSLMPWFGDKDNMIDRFDVRAHLDKLDVETTTGQTSDANTATDDPIERQINYERYRNLVQNEFLGLNETKFLQQIWFEERFGVNHNQKDIQNKSSLQKKKLSEKKATIAYNYANEDSTSMTVQTKNSDSSESEDSSDEDYDFDTTVNIDQLDNESGHRINSIALKFGMKCDDFVKYLDEDKTEAEKIRVQKELENEKSLFTGRKSRRERRALKEQRLLILRASNVEESEKSLAKKSEKDEKHSQSSSDSEVSVDENKIEFITSFGGSSEDDTRKEVLEKKPKQVVLKRKQKFKTIVNEKIETNPIVYGPTLPGEDMVSSVTTTSFHKSIHSKQRTYRFNESQKRSRSRSRSFDRYKYQRTGGRYRSPDRRSSFRTPDRYRDRSRSRSRDKRSDRRRSRDRDSRRDREDRIRRHRRSRSRGRDNRSRSRGRDSRRKSRSRSRSKNRRSKSKTRRSRSRSRRSRDRVRNRSRSPRNSRKRSPQRSKSEINRDLNSNQTCITSIPPKETAIESEEVIPTTTRSDEKCLEIDLKIENELNSETFEPKLSETETDSTNDRNIAKAVSPVVKSYYRAALEREGMSGDSDEELPTNETQSELDDQDQGYNQGSKKIPNISNTSNTCTQFGHKSSTFAPQERLKKKMQALIDKQYKRDKRAEMEKLSKQQQEREDREEELREMTSKLRYRRELYRERRDSRSPSTSKSRSRSGSSSSD